MSTFRAYVIATIPGGKIIHEAYYLDLELNNTWYIPNNGNKDLLAWIGTNYASGTRTKQNDFSFYFTLPDKDICEFSISIDTIENMPFGITKTFTSPKGYLYLFKKHA